MLHGTYVKNLKMNLATRHMGIYLQSFLLLRMFRWLDLGVEFHYLNFKYICFECDCYVPPAVCLFTSIILLMTAADL